MNELQERILALLVAKFQGVRKDGLQHLAAAIGLQVTTEEEANQVVDKLTADKVSAFVTEWRRTADAEISKANQTYENSLKEKYDFVVSRAVMPLADMVKLVRKNIKKEQHNALPNGLICLKGGELQHEILPFRNQALSLELGDYFKEEFFKTKKVVYVPL